MASLKDLIVEGSSRFLSDAYGDNIYANKFVTNSGTSLQFVKGDGTLDSTSYATSASLNNYLPLSGGTMTGAITTNIIGTSAVGTTHGINFGTAAHIGGNSGNDLGIYAINNIYIRPNQSSLDSATTVGVVVSSASMTFNNNTVWHAGNDGSGSTSEKISECT